MPVSPNEHQGPMTPGYAAAKRIISLLVVAGWAVFLSFAVSGKEPDPPREPDFDDVSAFGDADISRIDAWLQEQLRICKYPGLSVAVVRNGEIIYRCSLGFEDVKTSTKATPQTVYPVASVTKVFTASLAAILHERGIVDLDQPVARYLPKDLSISTTPKLGAKITLRQLASHTSGLPRGIPGAVQSVDGWYQLEPDRLYELLANVKLQSEPGVTEEYSNLGFGLLGHALECAAGKPFERLLQEMICEPLQLKSTAIPVDDKLHWATGYSSGGSRLERSASVRERLAPSGGLVTSVEDLAGFLAAQLKPGVFSSDMLKQLHTETTLANGLSSGTALGWTMNWSHYVGRFLEKNGGRNNCSAWIGFSPEYGVGVAVVTNCGGPDVDSIGRWLLERSVPGFRKKPATKYGYAKVAPWTGVRWENDRPIVRVQNRWSRLISVDGISIERIMEDATERFSTQERARKRLAEDLVEVLAKMGQEPDWNVTLELETQKGQVEQVQILMTEENRDLTYE